MFKHMVLLLLLTAATAPAVADQLLDRTVAIVNDDVILQSELDAELRQISAQLQKRGVALPPQNIFVQQVLQRMVINKLQLQRAELGGIVISDDMLNQYLSRIAQQNGLTLADLPAAMARDGVNYADYREDLRKQATIDTLQRIDVLQRISVSDREIDSYLAAQDDGGNREYHLAQIFVALPNNPSPEEIASKQQRAEQILGILRDGGDFAETAVAYSDGQQALQGGDLGWRTQAQIPSALAPAVVALKTNGISDILRSPSGFYIVKLLGTRSAGEQAIVITQPHARHILIKTNTLVTDAQARAKLAALRQQILDGADFAELARENSDDPVAAQGGDLGWSNPGDYVPEFEQVLKELQPGEISQPFKTQFGWHIVQLLERREQDMTETVRRNRAARTIQQRKFEEQLPIWMQKLWDEAYLEFQLPGMHA